MEISLNTNVYNNKTSFKSRLNPVPAFKVTTPQGVLSIEEVNYKKLTSGFLKKITEFFCENFSKDTNDPGWLRYNDYTKSEKNEFIGWYKACYEASIKDESNQHLTLLVARDTENNIQGACLSFGCEDVPRAKYNTLYIDSLAVNKKFRGNNLAKIMLEKSIEAGKYIFTDVFLTGEKVADGFYKKLGFRDLDPQNPAELKVIKHMARQRQDYPKYTSFLTRVIRNDRPRWYEICSKSPVLKD